MNFKSRSPCKIWDVEFLIEILICCAGDILYLGFGCKLKAPQFRLPNEERAREDEGAKGSQIRQFYHAEYENGGMLSGISPDGDLALFEFVSSKFQIKTDQWGLGPRLGLESKWNVWNGFNLIGNGAFSILCSFFDLKSQYDDVILPIAPNAHVQLKENFHELTPICEAMLGLDYGICFRSFYIGATIGYEWQYWWQINHARRHYVQTLPAANFDMRGELQIQGLNASLKFDF